MGRWVLSLAAAGNTYYVYIYIYIWLGVYIYICVHIYIHMCTYMYRYIYTHIYTYIHIGGNMWDTGKENGNYCSMIGYMLR